MTQPTAERNSLFDFQFFRELLKPVALWAVADYCKSCQILSQKRRGRTQGEVAGFPRNQTAHENQFQPVAGLRASRVIRTYGASNTVLRDKKQFVSILTKLGAHVIGSDYDRCRVTICGSGERQMPVQVSGAPDPFVLHIGLTEAGCTPQTTVERPDHKGNRSLS